MEIDTRTIEYTQTTGNLVVNGTDTPPWDREDDPSVFGRLSELVSAEPAMLAVDPEGLARSFELGHGVVLWNPALSEPIGFGRVFEMMPQEAIVGTQSVVYEMGTLIVRPDFRRQGGSEVLIDEVVRHCLHNASLTGYLAAVAATTKSDYAARAFERLGWREEKYRNVMYISAGTCVCSGDQGNGFQQGLQIDQQPYVCYARREDSELIIPLSSLVDVSLSEDEYQQKRGACRLYTNDQPSLQEINRRISRQGYGESVSSFVRQLNTFNHYGNFGHE